MLLTAADTDELARPLIREMVRRKHARTGSKMLAYGLVADAVGKSASWVRKYLGGHDVLLRGHELINIRKAYDRLCERIEAEAEKEELTRRRILESFDAALGSNRPMVAETKGAEGGGEASALIARSGEGA